MTFFRSIKSPLSFFVLKEAALSGGSYLGCLQSVKKKTETPFSLAFSFLLALHGDRYEPHLCVSYTAYYAYADLRCCVLVMKTTLMAHLSLGPYKESVNIVQIQMPFPSVGRSFCPSGSSYALGFCDTCMYKLINLYVNILLNDKNHEMICVYA